MFAYNPTPDRSAEIILEGMQNFGQSIGQGLASLGGSIGKRLEQKQEDAAKAASIGEALNTMQRILPTYGEEGTALAGIITQDMEAAGNNTDKMAGKWMAYQPVISNFLSGRLQQSQYDAALELHRQKQALGGGGGSGSSTTSSSSPTIYQF